MLYWFVLELFGFCIGLVLVLRWSCIVSIALVLSWFVLVWDWYCIGVVLILYWYYIGFGSVLN